MQTTPTPAEPPKQTESSIPPHRFPCLANLIHIPHRTPALPTLHSTLCGTDADVGAPCCTPSAVAPTVDYVSIQPKLTLPHACPCPTPCLQYYVRMLTSEPLRSHRERLAARDARRNTQIWQLAYNFTNDRWAGWVGRLSKGCAGWGA